MPNDQKNNSNSDLEYHYPDEEGLGNDSVRPERTPENNPSSHEAHDQKLSFYDRMRDFIAKNQRKVFVILLICVLWIVFQISTRHKINPMSINRTAPVQKLESINPNRLDPFTQKIHAIEVSQQSNDQNMMQIKATVSDLEQEVRNLDATAGTLRDAMIELLKELRDMRNTTQNEIHADTHHNKKHASYTVRAVVEQRAWIVGSNGFSGSVAVGDHIPDYGVVKHIDSVNGVITTSTGARIRLGNNDF